MTAEALKIIVQAWTQDTVTSQGKYWQFDEALPTPKPYQQPHPPIWVAAHSAGSFEYAATHNYHIAQHIDVDTVIREVCFLPPPLEAVRASRPYAAR
jgi:alkanesulfonate monooxygenase SsuD/methylene tetrahydromethanopterin reductase-like flavin-dependent oxidoreductase (luciferase family)